MLCPVRSARLRRDASIDLAEDTHWISSLDLARPVAAARLLLDNGAEVDRADKKGETPLFIAALNGHEAAVRCRSRRRPADRNGSAWGSALAA